MEPAVRNSPSTKQSEQEGGLWKWVGDISQSTLEGIKAVAAPGFSANTSLFGAATRACYWLAQESWQTLFGSAVSVGDSKEGKQLSENWEDLRKTAPTLDRLGKRLGEIATQLEGMPLDSPSSQELIKQRGEIAKELEHRLNENANKLSEANIHYAGALKAEVDRCRAVGLSTEEIEKKTAPLTQSHDQLEKVVHETLKAIEQLRQINAEHHERMHEHLLKSIQESHELAQRNGVEVDPEIDKQHERLILRCKKGACHHDQKLKEIQDKLECGNVEGSYADLHKFEREMFDDIDQTHVQVRAFLDARNKSLLDSGVSAAEVAKLAEGDKQLINELRSFAKNASIALMMIHESYGQVFSMQEELNRQSMQYLRMNSSSYNGGAGANVLTLGMYEGPYALTALSYVAEQERLEKLAKKFSFLAPPATQEEREEYRKIS